jgi:type I restriction enzyme, R subunit
MSISGSNPVPKIQSEQILENELVAQLISQGYARAAVTDEESMLANLKAQLEAFNGVTLTAGEFTKVMHHLNKSAGVFAKAKILRDRMKLEKEDGTTVYLSIHGTHNGTTIRSPSRLRWRALTRTATM